MITPQKAEWPVYTFRVNNIDYPSLFGNLLPDNIDNIVNQLQNAVVYIEGVGHPLKYGDTFTLSGETATRVKNIYINKLPKMLEIIYLPNVSDLSVAWEEEGIVKIAWTPSTAYYTEIEVSVNGEPWDVTGYEIGEKEVLVEVGSADVMVRAKFFDYGGAYSPDYVTATLTELPLVTTDSLVMHNNADATIDGTVVSQGSTDLTAYGFVWATHDNPTLDDNVFAVDTDPFTGSFEYITGSSAFSLGLIYVAAYATNSSGTSYGEVLSDEAQICLMAGTLITLPNNKVKKIENIDYNDHLLAWNFDDAVFATAQPVWMVKPFKASRYALVRFSDGSSLGTITDGKGHRIFNREKGMFTHVMSEDTPIGTTTFTDQGLITSLISKEIVEKEVNFYNIITHTHINVFANGVLTSTGLNNLYPVSEMKFVKEPRPLRNQEEFGVNDELFTGLRLAEQPASYVGLKEKIDMMKRRQK